MRDSRAPEKRNQAGSAAQGGPFWHRCRYGPFKGAYFVSISVALVPYFAYKIWEKGLDEFIPKFLRGIEFAQNAAGTVGIIAFLYLITYVFILALFAPAFLLVKLIRRRIQPWRPVYWVIAWTAVGAVSSIPFALFMAVSRQPMSADIAVLGPRMLEAAASLPGLSVFGALCGISSWLLSKLKRDPVYNTQVWD
jgi:hypothetical protein